MTPPDPRPPTILSEHGEGYCRVCHFVVGLTPDGKLAQHERGTIFRSYGETAKPCKGGSTRPPKLTPHSSGLAAFRATPPTTECPDCRKRVALLSDGTASYMAFHPSCEGSYRRTG